MLDLNCLEARGWLAERIDRGYAAVCNLRGSLWWHGSGWGYEHAARWLRNVTLYAQYSGHRHPAASQVVETMLDLIEDGQAFKDYRRHALAAYNEEEFLGGLLACCRHSPDTRVLDAARRMGQSIAEHHRELAGNHYYKGLAISPLLELATVSGDRSFEAAAVEIAQDQRLAVLHQPGGSHGAVAGMILCGHLDLYERTGSPQYLGWAREIWEAVRARTFVTGGLGEVLKFEAPPQESDLHDETCQHSWWMIANLRLWSVTGDPQYLEQVERTFYNHFLFAQLHRGEDAGFCALGDIDQGFRGQHNYICCDNEGFLGFIEILRHAVTENPKSREISVNLLLPMEARPDILLASNGRIRIDTEYPVTGTLRAVVTTSAPAQFSLRLRIPGGVDPAAVCVNDDAAEFCFEDGYAVVQRTWRNGDVVRCVFPMLQRVEIDDTGAGARSAPVRVDGRAGSAKRIGVLHGPVVAALFRTGHGNDLSWVWNGDYPEVLDSGGCVFQGHPQSKSDYLEIDQAAYHTGAAATVTEVSTKGGLARLQWTLALGPDVTVTHEVAVLPGLPVTMDWCECVTGWDGKGRLYCSGLRYATAKRTQNGGYGRIAFPYPAPAITTRDDLSAVNEFVAGGGSFSLAESIADDDSIRKTGTFRLSNGYFRTICHYGIDGVDRVVARVRPDWTGIYMVPVAGNEAILQRRLIFPLYDRPLSQDLTLVEKGHAARVQIRVSQGDNGVLRLNLDGPAIEHTPVLIPKSTGCQAGYLTYNAIAAAVLSDYDEQHLIARLPVPGEYSVLPVLQCEESNR